MKWEALHLAREGEETVGLEHCADGTKKLHLPLAYVAPGESSLAPRALFVELFRVLKKFLTSFSNAGLATDREVNRYTSSPKGQSLLQTEESQPSLGFYLLDLLGQLLEELNDPAILTVAHRQQLRYGHMDTRYISRYLHLALFQDDGSPVFEGMPARQATVRDEGGELIELAAWLVRDMLRHFYAYELADEFEKNIAGELDLLADAFATTHLHQEIASVMTDAGAAKKLREVLHSVEDRTPFRPPKFEFIADTIDQLLTAAVGSEGQLFGAENFYEVWESLGLQTALREYRVEDIFTCDQQFLSAHLANQADSRRWRRNAALAFHKNAMRRRPDLVVAPDASGQPWRIVDFKYYSMQTIKEFPMRCGRGDKADRARLAEKLEGDLTSGEIYRMLLSNYLRTQGEDIAHEDIRLEFWIPGLETCAPEPIIVQTGSDRFANLFYREVNIRQAALGYIS